MGILIVPSGFKRLPGLDLLPGSTLPLTQGSSGGVHVGLKMIGLGLAQPGRQRELRVADADLVGLRELARSGTRPCGRPGR